MANFTEAAFPNANEQKKREGIELIYSCLERIGGQWTHYMPQPNLYSFYRRDVVSGEFRISIDGLLMFSPDELKTEVERWSQEPPQPNSYISHWQREVNSLREGLRYQNKRADEAERLVDKYRGFDTEPEEGMLKGQELPYMDPGLRLEALKLAAAYTNSSEDALVMAEQFCDFVAGKE